MLNKINHKPQSHAKVCDENEEENKEKKQLAVIFLNEKDRF